MTDFQSGIAKLLNLANNKLSAASYRDLESLCREAGWNPDSTATDQEISGEYARKILDALSGELGTDDLDDIISALAEITAANDDTVPPFPGKPDVGGQISAQDRKRRFRRLALDHLYRRRTAKPTTWADIVPEAVRIEAGPVHPMKSDHNAIGQDSAALNRWERDFPMASRIKL